MLKEENFLADIVAHPEDDAPRLVFADWLEENGDEAGRDRAEFIRLQYRLLELSEGHPERAALQRREAELLFRYAEEWVGQLAQFVGGFGFERGFVSFVRWGRDEQRDRIDLLADAVKLAPVVEVQIGFLRPDEADRLLQRKLLLHPMRGLQLDGLPRGSMRPLCRLLESPEVAGLRSLLIRASSDEAESELLTVAVSSPTLRGLTELGIHTVLGTVVSVADFLLLLNHSAAPLLRRLTVLTSVLSEEGLDALRYGPVGGSLEILDLRGCWATSSVWSRLARADFPRLALLDVSEATIEPRGDPLTPTHPEGGALLERFGARRVRFDTLGVSLPWRKWYGSS